MKKLFALPLVIGMYLLLLMAQSAEAVSISSKDILPADGITGQSLTRGNGIKTGHIQDAAVTSSKIATGAVTDAKISGSISATKISGTVANADTVDGMHAAEFAPTLHSHDAETIVSGTVGADRLATYKGILVIHKGAVDNVHTFSTIGAALTSIKDSSISNRYAVVVMPGVYTENFVTPDYVDIIGQSRSASIIEHLGNGCRDGATVQMGAQATISRVTVRVKYAAGPAVLLAGEGSALLDSTLEITGTDPMCAGRMTFGVVTTNTNRVENVQIFVENYYPQQSLPMQIFSTANWKTVVRNITIRQPLQLPLPYPPYETFAWAIDVHTPASTVDVPLEMTDILAGGSITVNGNVRLQNAVINGLYGNDGETHVDNSVIKGDVTSASGTINLGNSKVLGNIVPQGGQIKTYGCYNGQYEAIINGLH